MATDDRVYAIWLSLRLGSKSAGSAPLYTAFSTAREIYEADDLSGVVGLSEKARAALASKDLSEAERILEACEKKNIGVLSPSDDMFPRRLRTISNPPSLLYYRGSLKDINGECVIGMVGTRAMSDYGRDVTYAFAGAFAKSGAVVVSGLAAGVDAVAHRGSLDGGGYTVAVLGTPIDRNYPAENSALYELIEQNGVIFSEYYPGAKTGAYCFPVRNRLIAGLSHALVVCEAGESSGALITARDAVMQGRLVFAIPGPAGSATAVGTNDMLRKGANMAGRPYDVLSHFEVMFPDKIRICREAYTLGEQEVPSAPHFEPSPSKASRSKAASSPRRKKEEKKAAPAAAPAAPSPASSPDFLEPSEKKIYDAIDRTNGSTADTVAAVTGLDITEVLSTLTMLEIYGVVRSAAGGKFYIC